MSEPASPSLRARVLAAYALPMAPLQALHFPVYVYVAPHYASLGADLALLGAFLLAARLLDAVTDPMMGVLSDRTPGWMRGRGGRRRPWMLIAAPLILVSAWQLFLPPEAPSAVHAGIWLSALALAWTVAMTPYLAWGAELSAGYAERSRVTAWRESVGLVGLVGAAVLYSLGGDAGAGLANIFWALLILLPLAFAIALRGTPEGPDLGRERVPLRRAAALALANRPFLRLLAAWFVNGAANALPAALFLFFVQHRLESPDWAGPLLVLYFAAAIAGAPLWSRATRTWPKHRVWSAAMVWAGAVFLFALALGPGDVVAFAVISVLSGLALGADLSLPPAMQADVVDADTAETGEQRTGAYFAVWSVATKTAQAAAGGAALLALDVAGFDASAESNDATALWTLALLYAAAPVALKAGAVALVWRFPIDAEAQADLRRRIEGAAQAG
jgi:Na+/melibiose symporter-like transporter